MYCFNAVRMIRIQTSSVLPALKEIGADLSITQLNLAISRAINRSLEKSRTGARTEIKKVYNISQKDLDGINYTRSTPHTLTGKLQASRKPIPLDAFSPKQETTNSRISITRKGDQKIKKFKRNKSNPTAGISIEIKKGEEEIIPFAFMIAGGAVRVFARGQYKNGTQHGFIIRHSRVSKTGSDIPIKPLITISEFGSILNPRVLSALEKQIHAFYPARLYHELKYIVDHLPSHIS